MIAPFIIVAGVLAWAWSRRRSATSRSSGPTVTAGTNWSAASSSLLISPEVGAWLDRVASRVSFSVVVNSGQRDPLKQASLMATESLADLYALYSQDDLVDELAAVLGDSEAMAAVIADQVARGRYISAHMRGDAVDLRTSDLSVDQVNQLIAAAQAEGGETVLEYDHLHVEDMLA